MHASFDDEIPEYTPIPRPGTSGSSSLTFTRTRATASDAGFPATARSRNSAPRKKRPATPAVDIPPDIHRRCEVLAAGVSYAIKTLSLRLNENPRLGRPTGEPSEYVIEIDGETFEDCPALHITYTYGPPVLDEGQLRITAVESTQTHDEPEEQAPEPVPYLREQALRAEQVATAWGRFTTALEHRAPATYALLKPAASTSQIRSLEAAIGIDVPAELQALWRANAGTHNHPSASFLLGDWALMDLDAVTAVHQRQMALQQDHGDEPPWWQPCWIPFASWDVTDVSYGLYLDIGNGEIGHWSRFNERHVSHESLTVYLEDMADRLEAPSLVGHPKPGLIADHLHWGPPQDPDEQAVWEPLG